MERLDLWKEKKKYVETTKIYRVNGFSIHKMMKAKEIGPSSGVAPQSAGCVATKQIGV